MNKYVNRKRYNTFKHLQETTFDVLVVGGGITGAGIALDAVNRGMHVGLVEMQDFAAGTSSRSTKLVHGGLRYLKQLEVGLVAEVGKERAIVYENGPHVTTPEAMMLPFYKGGTFGPLTTNVALRMYDFLAGVKKSERRVMLSKKEALEKEPLLKREGLKGAGYYVEYKTDDARLTIEVLKKAAALGAHLVNYVKVTGFLYDTDGKVSGVKARDQLTGTDCTIHAEKVINAAGPWVDNLREMDGSKQGKTLQLTKGTHLVFDQHDFPLQQAVYFDVEDGRMIFAIPREGKTYVGTTDTVYDDAIAHPLPTADDRDYLLDAINRIFPELGLTKKHIDSSWAGVRPLIYQEGKDPSEISRKEEIFHSASGLYSMAGGKLTGYRKMAEEVVDKIAADLKQEKLVIYDQHSTKNLPMSGGNVGGAKGFKEYKKQQLQEGINRGIPEKVTAALVSRYGSNVEFIFKLYEAHREEAEKEGIDPVVLATLEYAIEEEFACTPVDYFIRRTGALFFNLAWVRQHQAAVIHYMQKKLGWSQQDTTKYKEELETAIREAALEETEA